MRRGITSVSRAATPAIIETGGALTSSTGGALTYTVLTARPSAAPSMATSTGVSEVDAARRGARPAAAAENLAAAAAARAGEAPTASGAASERTDMSPRRTKAVVNASAYFPANRLPSTSTICSATAWKNFVLTGAAAAARASSRPMSKLACCNIVDARAGGESRHHAAERLEKCAGEDAREVMSGAGQLGGWAGGRQRQRIHVNERIGRVAETVAIDSRGIALPNRKPKLLGDARHRRIAPQVSVGFLEHRLPHGRQLQRREDRAHIAERLVKRRGFDRGELEQRRLQAVEDRVTELVGDDVRALAREHRGQPAAGRVADGVVEEREALLDVLGRKVVARVVGVQIDAVVETDRNRRADIRMPASCTGRGPEPGGAPQRLSGRPIAEPVVPIGCTWATGARAGAMMRVGSGAPGIEGTGRCNGGSPPIGSVGHPWIDGAAAAATPGRRDAARGAADFRATVRVRRAADFWDVNDRFPDLRAPFLFAMLLSPLAGDLSSPWCKTPQGRRDGCQIGHRVPRTTRRSATRTTRRWRLL